MKKQVWFLLWLVLVLGAPVTGQSQNCPGVATPCGGQGAKVASGLGERLEKMEAQVKSLDHLETQVAPLQKGERWMAFLVRRTAALEERVLALEKTEATVALAPTRGPLKQRLDRLEQRIKALNP